MEFELENLAVFESDMQSGVAWGEKALYWSVLERGVLDAIGKIMPAMSEAGTRICIREARDWIFLDSEKTDDRLITFAECCEVLDLSMRSVRNAVKIGLAGESQQWKKCRGDVATLARAFG